MTAPIQQQNIRERLSDTINALGQDEPAPVAEDQLTDFLDYPRRRRQLLERMEQAVAATPPVSNNRYTLQLKNVKYRGGREPTRRDHRDAVVKRRSLNRPLAGTYELVDNTTGKPVASVRKTILNVPWMTDNGTFVREGTEYTVRNQFRLDPGVFVHFSNDGYPEAQINTKARTGPVFRTYLEPETGIYHMRIRGRKVMLYPVLREMGLDDERIRQAWGEDLWKLNAQARVPAHTVRWIAEAREQGAKYLPEAPPTMPDDDPDEREEIPDEDE